MSYGMINMGMGDKGKINFFSGIQPKIRPFNMDPILPLNHELKVLNF
jgi:hypothetical protein